MVRTTIDLTPDPQTHLRVHSEAEIAPGDAFLRGCHRSDSPDDARIYGIILSPRMRPKMRLGTPDTRLESEPLAVDGGSERAFGLLHVRERGGGAVVRGAPAHLRAFAAVATTAAEQAEEMIRRGELPQDAGVTERLGG